MTCNYTTNILYHRRQILCTLFVGGVKDGTIVSIEDFTQDLEVQVVVRHVDIEALTALKTGNIVPSPASDQHT